MKEVLCRAYPYRPTVVAAALTIFVGLSLPFIPTGIDWTDVLRPATIAFLRLQNPYQIQGSLNPPWLFVLLAPIAILPENIGGALLFWLNLATWMVIAKKLGSGNVICFLAVVTSPMVINSLVAGNVDFLVMWGLLLPPELAIFFLTIKPQVGGAALFYIALRTYHESGTKRVLQIFAIPLALITLSLILYGAWPLEANKILNMSWNASPLRMFGWPSVAIGFIILLFGISRKCPKEGANISMASTPFFSPYVGSQSWVAILPSLIKTKALYFMWIALWLWVAYRTLIR